MKKEQKLIITDKEIDINIYLEAGWEVISVTPQYVSVSMTGGSYNYRTEIGKFAIVIQKQQ
jgi:hypothetical protein